MATKYPDRAALLALFGHLSTGDYGSFFSRVADDVDWTILGTSPMSKTYASKAQFQAETLGRLSDILEPPGLRIHVHNVVGGGDEAWATAEMKAKAVCKNGRPYDMVYCWACRFDSAGTIVQVRAYLDTAALTQALVENECPSFSVPVEL